MVCVAETILLVPDVVRRGVCGGAGGEWVVDGALVDKRPPRF